MESEKKIQIRSPKAMMNEIMANQVVFRYGDIIQEVEPFARVLLEKERANHCFTCHRYVPEKAIFTCSNCLSIAYCSKKCQKYDWKGGHRNECELLKQPQTLPGRVNKDNFHCVLRTLALLKQDPTGLTKRVQNFDGTTCSLWDLIKIVEKNQPSPDLKWREFCKTTAAYFGKEMFPPEVKEGKEMVFVGSLINTWSEFGFSWGDAMEEEKCISIGLWVGGQGFLHSCQPNCSRCITVGGEMQIRCIEDISSEPFSVSFLTGIYERKIREEKLGKFFPERLLCLVDKCLLCRLEDMRGHDIINYGKMRHQSNKLESFVGDWKDCADFGLDLIQSLTKILNKNDDRILRKRMKFLAKLKELTKDRDDKIEFIENYSRDVCKMVNNIWGNDVKVGINLRKMFNFLVIPTIEGIKEVAVEGDKNVQKKKSETKNTK